VNLQKAEVNMKLWRRESALDVYNLLLAVVLLAAPWLFALTNSTGKIDLWASGAAIAAISLAALVAFARWEEWANLLLGLWLIASPWLLGFAHTRAMHFSIGIGCLVAFMALLELWLLYEARHAERAPSSATSEQH
jgi:SPW repeat